MRSFSPRAFFRAVRKGLFPPKGIRAKFQLFAGAEYLFGERETLNGEFGDDHGIEPWSYVRTTPSLAFR